MGLDYIELSMELEEAFGVKFDWESREVGYVLTVGSLVELVLSHVEHQEDGNVEFRRGWAWDALRSFLESQPEISHVPHTEETSIDELLPKGLRRVEIWEAMREHFGPIIVSLQEPAWREQVRGARILFFVASLLPLIFAAFQPKWWPVAALVSTVLNLPEVLILIIKPIVWIADRLTGLPPEEHFRLPANHDTLGQLTERIAGNMTSDGEPLRQGWLREGIETRVIDIVSEVTSVPRDKVTLESDLYRDLGLS